MMSTVWVHPNVPVRWGSTLIVHAREYVAWIGVDIVGVSRSCATTDQRVEVVQSFIDAMGWKGKALNNYRGTATRNRVLKSNNTQLQLAPGANGLLEYSGGSVIIIWEWEQVFTWLREGWPTKRVSGNTSSPVGTWCYSDGVDPNVDHICRDEHTGWPFAMKQMRTVGVPPEVRRLKRPMTELEMIDGLCGALKNHRVKLNQIHR